MINLRLPASTQEKPFRPAVGSFTTRITARPRARLTAILGLITLTTVASGQECVLVQCESTEKHVALRFNNDHYILHFHARYKDLAGQPCFARVRTQVGSDPDAKTVSQNVILLEPETSSDIWSIKMRIPRFSSSANQNSAIYQLELGRRDRSRVDEFVTLESFAWKVTRDAQGNGRMVAGPSISLPLVVRVPRIVGSKVVIETEALVKAPIVDLEYGFSKNISLGSNNHEQSAERVAP